MIKLNLDPKRKLLREFGSVGFVALPAVWCLQWGFVWLGLFSHGPSITQLWWMSGIGIVLGGFALIAPMALKPVWIVVSIVTIPIGLCISYVLMALLYFGLFTPVALLFRAIGRDRLDRRLDPAVASYWVEKTSQRQPASYFRLF